MKNIPEVMLGIVVGSTNWMSTELAILRRQELVKEYVNRYGQEHVHECQICIDDNEISVKRALKDIEKAGCNALCLCFGNYGPEHTSTILVEQFAGPIMFCAIAENSGKYMQVNRKDSYSGLLNACYGLNLKKKSVYLPSKPVGTKEECANMIYEFFPIARSLIAVKELKIISFGPRPSSYFAACAPNHLLYELGVEIDEYSEMELFNSYEKHEGDQRIESLVSAMKQETGESNHLMAKYAQYEITVNDWVRAHKGNCRYVTLTSTCWPAFPLNFGFVPCYVNSRLTREGIPVACEVDVYGALSEYIGQCISGDTVTILNYNNNIPEDIFEEQIKDRNFNGKEYKLSDLFLGYHCGVTDSNKLQSASLEPHFVNARLIGQDGSHGTIQGEIKAGVITCFRIQGDVDGHIKAYVAEGQVLPVHIDTYGGRGVIAISEMERFYRNVLLDKHYPNHFSLLFGHYGKQLMAILTQLGIKEIEYNHPENVPYLNENIFENSTNWY